MKIPTVEEDKEFLSYFNPQHSVMEMMTWVNLHFNPEDIYTVHQLRECFKRLAATEKAKKK
jgi:hypothetical protein